MEIKRSGTQASATGPAKWFTGQVRIDAPFNGSGALSGATVRVPGCVVCDRLPGSDRVSESEREVESL